MLDRAGAGVSEIGIGRSSGMNRLEQRRGAPGHLIDPTEEGARGAEHPSSEEVEAGETGAGAHSSETEETGDAGPENTLEGVGEEAVLSAVAESVGDEVMGADEEPMDESSCEA